MDRSLHIANCILLLNNFDELKRVTGELVYKLEVGTNRITFYFPVKSFEFNIYLKEKRVYYVAQDGTLDKNALLLLCKIVNLFEKEFFGNEGEEQNETRKILF